MDQMDAIKAIYFQECAELLADLEQGLLRLQDGGDDDTINAVFRAVHSVKGGAGAFGFDGLVAFAHVFETTLDWMRSGKLHPNADILKVMLRAADMLSDHVQAAKGEGVVDEAKSAAIADELAAFDPEAASAPAAVSRAAAPANPSQPASDEWGFTPVKMSFDEPVGDWLMSMTPTAAMYAKGHDAQIFLRELDRHGRTATTLNADRLPLLDALDADESYLEWLIRLPGSAEEAAILEVFDFVGEDCVVALAREASAESPLPDLPVAFSPAVEIASPPAGEPELAHADKATPTRVAESAAKAPAAAAPAPTIRVDLDRVDRMIDLVGELVINQAMITQRVAESELARSSTVAIGLSELEQLTREIQDSVMAIRAQPVKSVFQRMPRLVREIADATNKQVRLVMEGENTEVDKTIIERLSDPITHMLRNAIDHGLETPDERRAAGKLDEGVVRLAALHRSGRIVIEVSDDGRGINRLRVRSIAEKKGLLSPDAALTDDEIDNLIFLPGFSTAETVSNISGRGVGMDVVKRSIQSLGGRIAISSNPGKGSAFTLSLPLTLAVLDGMVVTVGEQTLVAPLSAIIETLRPKPDDVKPLGPEGTVLSVRGGHVPLIDIGVSLGWRSKPIDPSQGVALLVESEVGGRAALVVDAIQGQRQVVIKSLEANYQRVDAIAAATILGDGRVALILDVDVLVDLTAKDRVKPRQLAQAS